MSSVPTGTSTPSISRMARAMRRAIGTPRRRIPISAKFNVPPLRSTISCATRCKVRSISVADMSCDFSTTFMMLDIVTQTAKESARRAHAARPGAFAPSVHAKILRGKDERGLRMRHRFRALFAGWGLVLLCGGALWTKPRAITPRPKLVVLLVVDQMRADYVDHFHAQWGGGLERLVNQGAWFQHAVYPYLTTVTCAGHATISTGQLPDAHGIIANAWLDRASGKMVSCTADSNASDVSYGGEAHEGDSAWRLEAPSFAEELRAQGSGQTRVVSFSIKARAAIMLAGHKADAIAWHDDKTGLWVTSSAYHDAPFIPAYTKTHPVAAD